MWTVNCTCLTYFRKDISSSIMCTVFIHSAKFYKKIQEVIFVKLAGIKKPSKKVLRKLCGSIQSFNFLFYFSYKKLPRKYRIPVQCTSHQSLHTSAFHIWFDLQDTYIMRMSQSSLQPPEILREICSRFQQKIFLDLNLEV